jgi:hypothetical protein
MPIAVVVVVVVEKKVGKGLCSAIAKSDVHRKRKTNQAKRIPM